MSVCMVHICGSQKTTSVADSLLLPYLSEDLFVAFCAVYAGTARP